jgi:UDP-2-acetamido-3-amino-2,3-dideoxy-glucuronate N-acetyltransferase
MPNVNDIKVDNLPRNRDARGNLVAAEFSDYVPFQVVRLFYVHDVPVNTIRGKHAHRRCRQYMICQTGRVIVDATDGKQTRKIELTAGQSIFVEPGIFFSEKYVERDTVLLILCDSPYDSNDYIESMDEFSEAVTRDDYFA